MRRRSLTIRTSSIVSERSARAWGLRLGFMEVAETINDRYARFNTKNPVTRSWGYRERHGRSFLSARAFLGSLPIHFFVRSTRKSYPVISRGWGRPKIPSMVGEI